MHVHQPLSINVLIIQMNLNFLLKDCSEGCRQFEPGQALFLYIL